MQDGALVQRRPHGPVKSVFQIHGVPPQNDVRKQIAKKRRILSQQGPQIQGGLGGDQLIEPDLPGRYRCPILGSYVSMVGVGASVANSFEDHSYRLKKFSTL